MRAALVLQHGDWGPPGLLADWAAARGIPLDIHRAREIASSGDPIPVGILYRNPEVPCYEDTRHAGQLRTAGHVRRGLETELDKYTVWPQEPARGAA